MHQSYFKTATGMCSHSLRLMKKGAQLLSIGTFKIYLEGVSKVQSVGLPAEVWSFPKSKSITEVGQGMLTPEKIPKIPLSLSGNKIQ